MKIAVLTSGRLPVPAVLGGAVENLIDFYLEYNNTHHLHDITVYSIKQDKIIRPNTDCNHYCYIDIKSFRAKIARKIFSKFNKSPYYDSEIEYFLHKSLKHLRRQNYDCVILENRPGYAMAVRKVTDAPIVLHLHNDLLNKDTFCGRVIYSLLSKVITVSNYIKGCVETLGAEIPVETVHNGIDLERFQRKPDAITMVKRADLNLREDDFVVVYSGRLTKEKGIKELLEAFLMLRDYPSIKLMVMGSSFFGGKSKTIDSFVVELQQLADKMPGKVVFTGFVSYDMVPCYLRLADIAVVPSMWEEPFALTCVEAMAAGLPIIATNSGGITESCGECAVIVDKNNHNIVFMLYEVILKLFKDDKHRQTMSSSGLLISQRYGKLRYSENFFNKLKYKTECAHIINVYA